MDNTNVNRRKVQEEPNKCYEVIFKIRRNTKCQSTKQYIKEMKYIYTMA